MRLDRLPLLIANLLLLLVMAGWTNPLPPTQIAPRPSGLALLSETELPVGAHLDVTVSLTNAEGQPIPNKTIRVYLAGKQVRQARTKDDGRATIRISEELAVGTYALRLVFPGTQAYSGDAVETTLVVRPIRYEVETVPPLPGIGFALNGRPFRAGEDGVARIEVDRPGTYDLRLLPIDGQQRPDTRIEFARWGDSTFQQDREVEISGDARIQGGFNLSHQVAFSFHDLAGDEVAPDRVTAFTLKSSHGAVYQFADHRARWLLANRVARRKNGLEVAPIQYAVESVMIDGANVVNKYQQRFLLHANDQWKLELLLYYARFRTRDALFGMPVGSAVQLTYPDERVELLPFDGEQEVVVGPLARGLYKVRVIGVSGMAPQTPVALSRDQEVELKVLTLLDMGIGALLASALALGLLFYGRPELLSYPSTFLNGARRKWQQWRRWLPGTTLFVALLLLARPTFAAPPRQIDAAHPVPLMAYYYIWYDAGSWERAKSDYPLLGRYSSDDREVMAQHVQWAKEAGIDGFIVSWKGTLKLDHRLEQLMDVAAAADFRLWIIYQGLDFDRKPLPLAQIDVDLDYFVTNYAKHPAFGMYDRPLIIWSGTWEFTPQEVAAITSSYRDRLLILASERNVEGYQRLGDYVDGNAYYWSSADPYGGDPLQQKLDAMSQAVHADGGLWVAPAAPGFDARLVGGSRVVPRQDGNTLRLEFDAAIRSSPDAIGLISWNEFSENSHVEPSENFGTRALEVISDIQAGVPPQPLDFDSSAPGTTAPGNLYPFAMLGSIFVFIAGSLATVVLRNRRAPQDSEQRNFGMHVRHHDPGSAATLAMASQNRTAALVLIGVSAIGLLLLTNRLVYTFSHWQTVLPSSPHRWSAPVVAAGATPVADPTEQKPLPTATLAEPRLEQATFRPVADGYVREEVPDKPGSDPNQLRSDGSPIVRSYLRFDLSQVQGQILTATLHLYASSRSTQGYEVHRVADVTWRETSLTYADAPRLGPVVGSSGPFSAATWTDVDVTSLFAEGAPAALSVAVTSNGATNISYGSRESNIHSPQLVLVTSGQATGAEAATPVGPREPTATPSPRAVAVSSEPPDLQTAPVLLAAGDIATCDRQDDEATASLLEEREGIVVALGDLAYEDGSEQDFANCYEPSWGRFAARTRPVPGNHEYRTAGALPYFQTFGATAGLAGSGYYSYTLGTWRVYALNSNCVAVGGCGPGSRQYEWLAQDLAQHPAVCSLAYWHHPRWSSGEHGNNAQMDDIWRLLADNGAELVLAGHDHDYERFAPLDAAGQPDADGIRSFVVGTGGKSKRSFAQIQPFSEIRNNDSFGILQVILGDGDYQWRFVSAEGNLFSDSGSGQCHP